MQYHLNNTKEKSASLKDDFGSPYSLGNTPLILHACTDKLFFFPCRAYDSADFHVLVKIGSFFTNIVFSLT